MEKYLNLRAYARHRGVTPSSVEDAVKSGRIHVSHREGNRVFFDVAQSDADWDANTLSKHGGKEDREESEIPQNAGGDRPVTQSSLLQAARVAKEQQLAKLKELEFEEKVGNVIAKSIVEKVVSKFANNARDALLNIPQRIAAEIAAETDPHLVEIKLSEEIRQVMNDFCNARLRY